MLVWNCDHNGNCHKGCPQAEVTESYKGNEWIDCKVLCMRMAENEACPVWNIMQALEFSLGLKPLKPKE